MQPRSHRLVLAATVAALMAQPALADNKGGSFKRVATIANYINNDAIGDETVSEIVAATADGHTLVYTDSELEEIGFVNIGVPSNPIPTGKFDVGGEPTSVAVLGNQYALVSVNTSESFTETGGILRVVDINARSIVAELDLGGQPDAIAISPDGMYAAVAIENERDEEICVGGTESGAPVPEDGPEEPGDITEDACEAGGGAVGVLPQTAGSAVDTNGNLNNPPGFLVIVDLAGDPASWSTRTVDLTGLADYAPEDPEPEFVDINAYNEVAISLQENNHLVVVDLPSGMVKADFPAGSVDLVGVDATEDGVISLTENLFDVPREPDAIAWVDGYIGTANEGDLFGGSRGFSLFEAYGDLAWDAGSTFEELAVRIGHYPEERSENKGSEPEAIEFGVFDGDGKIFVGSERGSFIGVYGIGRSGRPVFEQALPGPLAPEGLLAIPSRGLLVASGEDDSPSFGVRSTLMIYEYSKGRAEYPQLRSRRDRNGRPIGWSALSGMVARDDRTLLAVWDSFYSQSQIFEIRPRRNGGVVRSAMPIVGGSGNFDPEGIAIAPDGTYWIASEGNGSGSRLNRLLQTDTYGNVLNEVFLPPEIEACRAAERAIVDENGDPAGNTASHGAGFEGVAILPSKSRRWWKRRGGYRL
ncbi:MAG: esterase-like activity of phytase family protein, partial [Pseudomonadota bacterium]